MNSKMINFIKSICIMLFPLSLYLCQNFHSASNLSFFVGILLLAISMLGTSFLLLDRHHESKLKVKEIIFLSIIIISFFIVSLILKDKNYLLYLLPYLIMLLISLLEKYIDKFLDKHGIICLLLIGLLVILNLIFKLNIYLFSLILFYVIGYFISKKDFSSYKILSLLVMIITLIFLVNHTYYQSILHNDFIYGYLRYDSIFYIIYAISSYLFLNSIVKEKTLGNLNNNILVLVTFMINLITIIVLNIFNIANYNFLIVLALFIISIVLVLYTCLLISKKCKLKKNII